MASHTAKGQLAKERALAAAETLFAESGFHGVGLREVADAAEMPLAGLQYHFGRKEKLYAAVLERIASDLVLRIDDEDFERVMRALARWAQDEPNRVRLLLRELLDNPTRVEKAEKLPLAVVLRSLASFSRAEHPELSVIHVVGALSYYVAARPTFRRLTRDADAVHASYADRFVSFARTVMGAVDGPTNANQPRSPRSRAHRATHDRHG